MDTGLGIILFLIVGAWIAHILWRGYQDENRPPMRLADNGHGTKEPICGRCQTRLLAVQRQSNSLAAQLIAWLFILGGLIALIAVNWLAGMISILLGVVIYRTGKHSETVLTCPACGMDAKRLD